MNLWRTGGSDQICFVSRSSALAESEVANCCNGAKSSIEVPWDLMPLPQISSMETNHVSATEDGVAMAQPKGEILSGLELD